MARRMLIGNCFPTDTDAQSTSESSGAENGTLDRLLQNNNWKSCYSSAIDGYLMLLEHLRMAFQFARYIPNWIGLLLWSSVLLFFLLHLNLYHFSTALNFREVKQSMIQPYYFVILRYYCSIIEREIWQQCKFSSLLVVNGTSCNYFKLIRGITASFRVRSGQVSLNCCCLFLLLRQMWITFTAELRERFEL